MKFLLELVACCGSCSGTSMVKEEARLLAVLVPPPSPGDRRRNRKRGRSGGPNGGGGTGVDWRPSLSSICEEDVFNERPTNERPHRHRQRVAVVRSPSSSSSSLERNLKRKITSTLRPRSSSPREDVTRRPAIHAVIPAFTPTPFMF